MADEPLIMKAGISYDPTPLNQLKRQLESLKSGSAKAIRKDFEEVRGSVSKAAAEIRNSLTPAMAAMGIGSLGVGAAITGVVAAVKSLTSGLTEMRMASKETGATVQELRELQALARRFDINPDAMSGGVMAFSDSMRQIKNKWGETYEWMRTASPEMAELGKKLFNAKNMDEALEAAMSGISGIQNPKVRQMLAEKLFGSRVFSQLGAEGAKSFEEIRAEIHKRIVALPPDADKVAREFKESLDQIGDAAVNLQTQFAKALLPVLPEIKAGIDEFTAFLRTEKKEISAFFSEVVTDARGFVHDLREHFDNLRSGYEAAKNFFGGEKTGGATHGIMPEASIGETVANPEIARRRLEMDELRRQHAILEENIARKESQPDPLGGEGHAVAAEERRRLDKLNEELKRLSDEIRELRQSTATVQQQSFNGGGGLGGLIQNASFGGGRPGGGRNYSGDGSGAPGNGGGSYGLNREGIGRAGRAAREGATGSPDLSPPGTPGKAVDIAERLRGSGRGQAQDALHSIMHLGQWCADFVNGALKAGGAKGSGSAVATSFLKWGQGVDPSGVRKGDVLVEPRGRGPGQPGGHVGLATGEKKVGPDGHVTAIEMIAGNTSGQVKKYWERASRLAVRRAFEETKAASQAPARSDGSPAAPSNWLGGATRAFGGGGAPEAHGSVNIALDGFPRGVRARTSMEGLFKEMNLTRGRSMEPSDV